MQEKEEQKLDKKEMLQNLKMSWAFAKKHKKNLFIYLFFTIILCIIGAITPMLSARELLKLTGSLWEELMQVALLVLAIELTRNICQFLASLNSQLFFRKTVLDLQMDLACETLALETKVLDEKSSGVFINRLNRDTTDIANIFMQLNYSISDMVTNIGIMAAIFFINKYVFIFYTFSFILVFIFKKMQMKRYFEHDKVYRKLLEKNTSIVTEFIRGMRDIKSLNAGDNFMDTMENRLKSSNDEFYRMTKITRGFSLITGSLQDILDFILILLGIFLIQKKALALDQFVVLFMYRYTVFNLLNFVSQFMERLKNFNLSAARVFEIMNGKEYTKEHFGTQEIPKIEGNFAFKNVTFGYKEDTPILQNLSFEVKANETVAFVGKSGAGKSTIFSLLNKLYDVKEGQITIDGVDIQDLSKESIRNNMTIISQTPYIFNFSIRENLQMVKKDATEEEMIEACKTACLHDFIMSLPEGYESKVGEGGVTLSGGQRQRLAIARALIKKTEIILFDEATSALDNETQRSIQTAINHMKGEYTILIIAHRLSTVIGSHRILVIDEGKIIGEGTHAELMQNNTFYRHLYEEELDM